MLDYCEVHGPVAILAPVLLLWYSRFRWILCSNIQLSSSHLLLFAIFSLCSSHHTPQTMVFYNICNQGFWFLKSWSSNALSKFFSFCWLTFCWRSMIRVQFICSYPSFLWEIHSFSLHSVGFCGEKDVNWLKAASEVPILESHWDSFWWGLGASKSSSEELGEGWTKSSSEESA
jgi:hypothetical protein